LDKNDNIYITGNYDASAGGKDFDPGPGVYYLNGKGGFILKLCQDTFPVLLDAAQDTICGGDTAYLSVIPIPGATYTWTRTYNGSWGMVTDVFDSTATLPVTAKGTYTVTIYGAGCPSTSNPVTVTVLPVYKPTISLSYSGANANIGQQVYFVATLTQEGNSYLIDWYKNGQLVSTTTQKTLSYSKQAGADTVYAVIYDTTKPCYRPDTSNTLIITTPVGIEAVFNQQASISLFPNPFKEEVHISIESS